MANILLISYYFPPLNTVACRRVYALARQLQDKGHRIFILTADIPSNKIMRTFNADISSLEVHRVKYFDPRILINKFFNAHGGRLENPRAALWERVVRLGYSLFLGRGILYGSSRMPNFSDLWFWPAYRVAKDIIRSKNIEVVVTSSPPPIVNLIGLSLKRKFKQIVLFADFRDLWTQNPTQKGLFPFTLLEAYWERQLFSQSRTITVTSEVWRKWLKHKFGLGDNQVIFMPNGYDIEPGFNTGGLQESSASGVCKRVIYAGTLYKERRDPEPIFKAIARQMEYFRGRLEVCFYGGLETGMIIEECLRKYPATRQIIRYGGFISSEFIMQEQLKSDVLIFIERDSEDDGTLPAKIFEYIAFLKPIICVGIGSSSYVGNFLDRSGLCVFCGNDVNKIAQVLVSLVEGTLRVSPRKEFIETLSRQVQIQKFDALLKGSLS